MKKLLLMTLLLGLSILTLQSHDHVVVPQPDSKDSIMVRTLFDSALLAGESYENLRYLCKKIGHRLTGSTGAEQAIKWGEDVMQHIGFDKVYLQEIEAPHWERGKGNWVNMSFVDDTWKHTSEIDFTILGGSVPTDGVLEADLIEIHSFDELAQRADEIKGKIVFFNKPMDKTFINTFQAYGACAGHRYAGASEAAKYGAVGVVVRSLTTETDLHPHTGSMGYKEGVTKIPAIAVSTFRANNIHDLLNNDSMVSVSLQLNLNCRINPNIKTYNVIGEVRGSKYPKDFLIVGGHLDSWDLGEGAHDDGAGCVQSMEAIRLLLACGYRPEYSMRAILYMNEESGNMGGKTYAAKAKKNGERHIFALETDRGGFSPRGYSMDAKQDQIAAITGFRPLLEPYGLHIFEKGFAGVDIYPLNNKENAVDPDIILMGLYPDPQRYFDYHHTDQDVFENVNKRELELGGASMAAMLYLVDRYKTQLYTTP